MKLKRLTAALAAAALFVGILPLNGFAAACSGDHEVPSTAADITSNAVPYSVCDGGWQYADGTAYYGEKVYECAKQDCTLYCGVDGKTVAYVNGDGNHVLASEPFYEGVYPYTACVGGWYLYNVSPITPYDGAVYRCTNDNCGSLFTANGAQVREAPAGSQHQMETYNQSTNLSPCAGRYQNPNDLNQSTFYKCTVCGFTFVDDAGSAGADYVEGDPNVHAAGATACTDPHSPHPCASSAHYHCVDCDCAVDQSGSEVQLSYVDHVPVGDKIPADYTPCKGGIEVDYYLCGGCDNPIAKDPQMNKWVMVFAAAGTGHAVPGPNEQPCTEGHDVGCKTTPHYHCPNCPDATAIDQNGNEVQVQADGHLYDPQQEPCTDPHGEEFCMAKPHYHCPECDNACNENGEEVNILADDIHWVSEGSNPCTESHGNGGCQAAVHYHCGHCDMPCDADGKPVTVQGGKHTPGDFIEGGDYTVCGGGINQDFYVCSVCWTPCDANGNDVAYTAPTALHTPGTEKNSADYIACNGGFKVDYYWCTVCQQPSDAAGNHVSFEEPTAPHDVTGAALNQPNYTDCTGGFKESYYLCNNCGTGCNANAESIWPYEANHDTYFVERQDPTDTTDGMDEHYACRNCDKLFYDQEGWSLIEDPADIIIPAGSQNGEGSGVDVSDTVADAVNDALQADPDAESVTVSIKEQVPAGDAASLSGQLMDDLANAGVGVTLETNDGTLTLSKEQVAALADQLPAESELVVMGDKEIGIPVETVNDNTNTAVAPINTELLTAFAGTDTDLVIYTDMEYAAVISADAVQAIANAAQTAAGNEVNLRVIGMEKTELEAAQQAALAGRDVAVVLSAELLCNGTKISSFGSGNVTLALNFDPPAGTNGSDYKFWYLNPNGQMEAVNTSYQDGALVATFPHFSEYALIYTATGAGVPGTPAPDTTAPSVAVSPATYDSALLLPYTVMMTVSAAGIVLLLLRKKREQ